MRTTRWGLRAVVLTAIVFMGMHPVEAFAGWMGTQEQCRQKSQ